MVISFEAQIVECGYLKENIPQQTNVLENMDIRVYYHLKRLRCVAFGGQMWTSWSKYVTIDLGFDLRF